MVWRSRRPGALGYSWAVNRGSEADDVVDNLEMGHAATKHAAEAQMRRAAAKWRAKLLGARPRRRGAAPRNGE